MIQNKKNTPIDGGPQADDSATDAGPAQHDGDGEELTRGTPEQQVKGPESDQETIPPSMDEVVAQVPSETVRRELTAGAVIGYRIVTFAVFLVFGLAFIGWTLFRLTHVLELFIIGTLIAMAVNPLVRSLEKRGVPRMVSVFSLLLLLALVILAFAASLGPRLVVEITDFISNFGSYVARLQRYVDTLQNRFPGVDIAQMSQRLQEQAQQQLNLIWSSATTVFTTSVSKVFETILVLFIVVFVLLDPDSIVRGFRSLMPDKWQPEVQRIGLLAVGKVEAWIQGSLLLMLAIGVVTTLALWWLGVPYPLLWGVLAGFLEIIPTLGPVIAAIPPALVGLTISPILAVKVLAAQFVIQQLESNILVPWIMSNKVRLHPVTLLFFLLGMAEFLGVFGALIATPLAAVLKVLYMELYYRRIHGTLPQDEAEDPIRMKILHRFAKRAQIGEPPGPPVTS